MTNKKAIMWARTSQDSSAAAATDDDDDAQIAPTQRWGNTWCGWKIVQITSTATTANCLRQNGMDFQDELILFA